MKVREIILKNFNVISIVSFGGKTFGKTPTPTFVLFIKKKEENPSKSEITKDSVEAIFKNEKLEDWEDKHIYNTYLETIGVKEEDYSIFKKRVASFDQLKSISYFKPYIDTFNKDTNIINLKESKRFKSLSLNEQDSLLLSKFYDQYICLEKEKIYYYALTYKQDILLINSPKDTDMQKKFLGYFFVNRNKKDILVETEGLLSDAKNRYNDKKMSWVVKEAFCGRYTPCDELDEYVSNTKLSSLLNFTREKFYKTIILSQTESLKSKYPSIRLDNEEIFTLFIGDRVLNKELVENGKVPVYSANVRQIFGYIDKQNVIDFKTPSILWGIDGDWIINFIPAGTVFYPTDHCGVLRIKTKIINPYYVSMALNIIGESYHFSRSNRASIDRVKDVEIPIPPKKIQDKIAKECESIDSEYNSSRMTMEEYRNKIKKVFMDLQIFEICK